ncbi:hypothetical protein BGP_3912 [Beggiatoa sp. PS]|nr:hypothetical protein BGP_3912 [Beggiatoa sp. PS]
MFDTSDNQEVAKRVVHILRILAKKIEANPELLTNAELSLLDVPLVKKNRTIDTPVDFDVFNVFAEGGEPTLRKKLELLEIKTLKSIITKNRFDPSKLAQNWRKKDRLIDMIVEKVIERNRRGQVFMEYPS